MPIIKINKFMKKLLLKYKNAIQRRVLTKIAKISIGANYHCIMCGNDIQCFMPYRKGLSDVPPLMRHLEIVGSDVENFSCPICACHDRERHLLMYLKASNSLEKMQGAKILHFAPEKNLIKIIQSTAPNEYILGDLYPTSLEIKKINLQAINYPNEYFDFVLANHVLEHVDNDSEALDEIYRVLRPGGYAILQTPFSNILQSTFSDPGINNEQARLHAYGQEDHQRLYGKNIFSTIQISGLTSLVKSHNQILDLINSKKMGVNPSEPFFLFKKPE
jgi:SAM-dependent methyltransferase